MEHQEADLTQVLVFREEKAAVQRDFMAESSEKTVVSLGMNVPGPVKTSPLLSEAFQEGVSFIEQMFAEQNASIVRKVVMERVAGYAAVWLIEGVDRYCLKKESVGMETAHPIGRLFDIDVIDEFGKPITRETVGYASRTCFLCGNDAKICGRSRTHSVKELQQKVKEILAQWKAGKTDEMYSGQIHGGGSR